MASRTSSPSRDLFQVLRRRRSIRSFTSEAIPEELMTSIFEAIRTTPTAGNLQAFKVMRVVTGRTRYELSLAALGQSCIAQAPEVLVFVALPLRSASRYGQRGADLYAIQDASNAALLAHIAAAALGLGSCWVGAFKEEQVVRLLDLDPHERPVALLPVGWPSEEGLATSRRPPEEILFPR